MAGRLKDKPEKVCYYSLNFKNVLDIPAAVMVKYKTDELP